MLIDDPGQLADEVCAFVHRDVSLPLETCNKRGDIPKRLNRAVGNDNNGPHRLELLGVLVQ